MKPKAKKSHTVNPPSKAGGSKIMKAAPIHNTSGGEMPDVTGKANKKTRDDSRVAFKKS